jgi:membrane protein DedA with SNARE-associated domain
MEVFEFLMPIFTEYGYLAVFVMLLICGFGVPIPEDVTLVTGGVIAGLGHADVHTPVKVEERPVPPDRPSLPPRH